MQSNMFAIRFVVYLTFLLKKCVIPHASVDLRAFRNYLKRGGKKGNSKKLGSKTESHLGAMSKKKDADQLMVTKNKWVDDFKVPKSSTV